LNLASASQPATHNSPNGAQDSLSSVRDLPVTTHYLHLPPLFPAVISEVEIRNAQRNQLVVGLKESISPVFSANTARMLAAISLHSVNECLANLRAIARSA